MIFGLHRKRPQTKRYTKNLPKKGPKFIFYKDFMHEIFLIG